MTANSSDDNTMNVSDLGNNEARTFLTGIDDPVLNGVNGTESGQQRIRQENVSDQIAEMMRKMQEYRVADNQRNDELMQHNLELAERMSHIERLSVNWPQAPLDGESSGKSKSRFRANAGLCVNSNNADQFLERNDQAVFSVQSTSDGTNRNSDALPQVPNFSSDMVTGSQCQPGQSTSSASSGLYGNQVPSSSPTRGR